MQVYLQTLAGKIIPLSVEPSETIRSAKARVQDVEGFRASQQQWMRDGQKLPDSLSFEDCNIEADSTIDLVLSRQTLRISVRTLTGELLRIETGLPGNLMNIP